MSSLIGIQEEPLVGSLLLACKSNGKDVLSKAAGFPETIWETRFWLCCSTTGVWITVEQERIQHFRPFALTSYSRRVCRGTWVQLAGQCHCTVLANACPVAEAQAKALEKTDRGVLGAFLAPAPSPAHFTQGSCEVIPLWTECIWKKPCTSALMHNSNDGEFVPRGLKKNKTKHTFFCSLEEGHF